MGKKKKGVSDGGETSSAKGKSLCSQGRLEKRLGMLLIRERKWGVRFKRGERTGSFTGRCE